MTATDSPSTEQMLVIPVSESLRPTQSIVTPPPPSHLLSAADDLVTRFQLHDSYRVLLHPFRKDVHLIKEHQQYGADSHRDKVAAEDVATQGLPSTSGPATPSGGGAATPTPISPSANTISRKPGNTLAILPRTFAHFLPPSLPGKVNPQKPPRKHQVLARKAAQQNLLSAEDQHDGGAGGVEGGSGASSGGANVSNKERALAKAQAEWERISTTLRRTVMKPEYTPADIRPLDEEAMRGYMVEAGEVPEIDRSQLEADALAGTTPPRKKKKKNHRPQASGPGSDHGQKRQGGATGKT
ncbi:unnamed protein product [Parajaminaea phylloscopi]